MNIFHSIGWLGKPKTDRKLALSFPPTNVLSAAADEANAVLLRKKQVMALAFVGVGNTGRPALTESEYESLLILERTSPHSSLKTNIRLAKLNPVKSNRNYHLNRRPLAEKVNELLRNESQKGLNE
jgi:hypothetical protein